MKCAARSTIFCNYEPAHRVDEKKAVLGSAGKAQYCGIHAASSVHDTRKSSTMRPKVFSHMLYGFLSGCSKYRRILVLGLIAAILVLALSMTQSTLGRFSKASLVSDSAAVAKLDVIITPPNEFWAEQDGTVFEYRFLSLTDIRKLDFNVYNNGETNIICSPQISGGIRHRVFVGETELTEFVIEAKTEVDFSIVMGPYGLDENIKNTELFVDVRQQEGG